MKIFSIGRLTSLLIAIAIAVGLATSAVPQARTVEPAAAELPFARSRDGVRETYIVSFGLFGPESVFASEAEKAAQILRARLQPDAQVLVRFNDKRGGSATSAGLAASLRSTGRAMNPDKDVLAVFLTSHGSPDGLAVVAGRHNELLSPRSFRSMLNASGARYRMVIISACYSGVFARALADARTLVITAAAPDRPSFGCEDGATWTYFGDAFFNQALRASPTLDAAFCRAREIVTKRERREGFAPSKPQMAGGSQVVPLLGSPVPVASCSGTSAGPRQHHWGVQESSPRWSHGPWWRSRFFMPSWAKRDSRPSRRSRTGLLSRFHWKPSAPVVRPVVPELLDLGDRRRPSAQRLSLRLFSQYAIPSCSG